MWQCEFFNICTSTRKSDVAHCQPHDRKGTCEKPHNCNRNPRFDGQQICIDLDERQPLTLEEAKLCGLL